MNNTLTKISKTNKYVVDNAKHVKINYDKIDEIIKDFKETEISFWLKSNPFNILDMSYESIVNFLLIYHTIGDYCFWGEPKWEIETKDNKLDGSYAMMYLILNRFKNNPNFEMSYEEFKQFLKGNVQIPLLEDRYNNLVKMNSFLKAQKSSFYNLIKDKNADIELFTYLIENLPFYKDERTYHNKTIYFYKRAQLLTSDILHVRESLENIKVDYSNLIGCADYKIPQVMRCLGMTEYSRELANLVDKKGELPENSEYEIEIRATCLIIIDYICQKLNSDLTRMDINDYIWLLGQDKTKITKPYHRTKTCNY